MATTILWFRNDLRLADNPALAAAIDDGAVVPVFVFDPAACWGGASRWWLHHSLASLGADLAARGTSLVLRQGDSCEIITRLARECGAVAVHAGRAHEPWLRTVDITVAESLKQSDIAFHRHRSALLFGPETITTKADGAYGVYTPFSRACFEAMNARPAIDVPTKIPNAGKVESDTLDDWGLVPTAPDWAGGLRDTWQPGEIGARERLEDFLKNGLNIYDRHRNNPGEDGTSMLSPHLHWGEISIDTVWREAEAAETTRHDGKQTYLKELLWREFSAYLLWHNPKLDSEPMKLAFDAMPWRRAKSDLSAWQRGQTGIPIVDAGMRQLWQIGWVHNRVRMIVASFLIKHLMIDWRDGEAWFWDTLVDADAGSNAASWQWVAGCGADAAPYFRVFNPALQGRKFDADGAYVRRFVSELKDMPDEHIHAPWDAPADVLEAAGVTLGKTYPKPLVGLMEGRDRALEAYEKVKTSS